MVFRERHDCLHIAGPAGEVNWNDGFRLFSDKRPYRLDGDVLRLTIDIRENWDGANDKYAGCRSHITSGRDNDFITGADIERA